MGNAGGDVVVERRRFTWDSQSEEGGEREEDEQGMKEEIGGWRERMEEGRGEREDNEFGKVLFSLSSPSLPHFLSLPPLPPLSLFFLSLFLSLSFSLPLTQSLPPTLSFHPSCFGRQ